MATPSENPEPRRQDERELAAWLRLVLVPGIGEARQRQLLAAFGPPEAVFEAKAAALAQVVGSELGARLLGHDSRAEVDAHLEWQRASDNHILTLADPDYPAALLSTADPPVLLFAKGRLDLLCNPALAIVGARSATPQGMANAESFARNLAGAGLTVVSGLALGIDAAAHRGALPAAAGTIAVMGTGADRIYPARNQALAREIAENGLIVTEFPLGTQAQRHNFPRRNRLIAGLSRGVLVVEAAVDSGSLITARLAGEQGREVFAIPGSIHSPLSKGCHRLIREGAKLVETASDILEELRFDAPAMPAAERPAEPTGDAREAAVLELIGHDPVDTDTLLQRSGLTPEALSAILLSMELGGMLARLPGGRIQRII